MSFNEFDDVLNNIKKLTRSRNQKEVAAALGISGSAITDAKNRNVIPETWFRIIEEKYKKNREELCKPEVRVAVRAYVDQPYSYQEITVEESNPSIPDMIYMTGVVLESNTVYRSALASNIRAFYQAVKGEGEMNDMRNEVNLMRQDIARLEALILNLSKPEEAEKKQAVGGN